MAVAQVSPKEKWLSLLEPGYLMVYAIYHTIIVVLQKIFVKRDPFSIFDIKQVKDEAFSRFWIAFTDPGLNPPSAELVGSAALIPPLLSQATGLVLDVGPGSGVQVKYFNKNPELKKIYGVEPNLGLHKDLRAQAATAGFQDRYHIIAAGAEGKELFPALAGEGLLRQGDKGGAGAVFDTIACIRVLCGVDDVQQTSKDLYELLKPGGKLIFVEHVVNPWNLQGGSMIARLVQGIYMLLGWHFFMGSCNLDRDTEKALIAAAANDGGWKHADTQRTFTWAPLTYYSGTLTKRG